MSSAFKRKGLRILAAAILSYLTMAAAIQIPAGSWLYGSNIQLNDFLVQNLPHPKPSGEVVTVSVTQSDKPQYYVNKPYPILKDVIAEVMSHKPKLAISTFIPYWENVPVEVLKDFVQFTQRYPNLYFYSFYEESEVESLTQNPILKDLNILFIPLTFDKVIPPYDYAFRRIIFDFDVKEPGDQPLLELLRKYGYDIQEKHFKTFKYGQSTQAYVRYRGKDTHTGPSLTEFSSNPSLGENTVIVFGTGYRTMENMLYRTPSIFGGTITAAMRIGMVIDTYISKDSVSIATQHMRVVLSLVLFTFYFLGLILLKPVAASIWGVISLILCFSFPIIAFAFFDEFLFLIEVPAVIFGIHFLASPALLIRMALENERNKLALQAARAEMGLKIATQVAHDIRAPLGAIQIASQLPDGKKSEAKELLTSSIDRLNRIADDLLQQFRSGRLPNSSAQVLGVKTFLEEFFKSVVNTHPELAISIDGDATAAIQISDKTGLERAFSNLINNSIEAGASKIQFSVEKDIRNCIVQFRDNGPGLPIPVREKLFERGATFGKSKGSGLGLAQVKEAVESLGGSISWIPSGQGTHFQLVFPLNT